MQITSPKNPHLQEIRKAASSGRPTPSGHIVAEGPHLVQEAVRSNWEIESVIATGEALSRWGDVLSRLDTEIIEVSERAFSATAATENGQGVLALMRPKEFSWSDLMAGGTLIVVLDEIQDPGNAGTIVRSAEAFGATGIVLLRGSVRISNGKLLRAAAGSLFRLPYMENVQSEELLGAAREARLPVYSLCAHGGIPISDADFVSPCVLAVGNEGAGVSKALSAGAASVSIPVGRVESLNAAVACAITLYEASRQRSRV